MSPVAQDAAPDLLRWTFTVDKAHRQAIEDHLADLGADVWVREEVKFTVTWDEPEGEMLEVIEALWAIRGEPFEVTQEEFRRLALHVLEHDDAAEARDAA